MGQQTTDQSEEIIRPFRLSVHAVILNSADELLVIRRSKESLVNSGKWDLPGGKIEVGEDFDEALKREVMEETGISIKIRGLLTAIESTTLVPDFIIVTLIMHGSSSSDLVTLSNEHDEFRWVPIDKFQDIDLCSQFIGLPISRLSH